MKGKVMMSVSVSCESPAIDFLLSFKSAPALGFAVNRLISQSAQQQVLRLSRR